MFFRKKSRLTDTMITRIDIVFENCECYALDISKFRLVNIRGISSNILNIIGKYQKADYVELRFTEEGLKKLPYHGTTPLGERLKTRDITNLDIFYGDKRHDYVAVPWDSETGFSNNCMTFEGDKVVIKSLEKPIDND